MTSSPSSDLPFAQGRVWPAFRGLFATRPAEAAPRSPQRPAGEGSLSADPTGSFCIQCLPLEHAAALSVRVEAECTRYANSGYALASSFSYDGNAFLVFKRA